MHAATTSPQFHRMFEVQHLVVNDVLHRVGGNSRVVKDAAHDDSIVGGIVVAEAVASMIAGPGHLRRSEQAVKESLVQIFKDNFEVVGSPLGSFDSLAAAHLAYEVCFPGDILPG